MDINIREIVDELNVPQRQGGRLSPINLLEFEKELNKKIGVYETSIVKIIRENWEQYCPNALFSENALEVKVQDYLEMKKAEAIEKFKKKLMRQEMYFQIRQFLFSKKQVMFLLILIVSLFTIPMELILVFSESNFGFYAGLTSLAANIFLIWRQNKKLDKWGKKWTLMSSKD